MAVRIIGHEGIVPQTNNDNVTLMVLEEFDCSFCYTSFTAWIQITTMWMFVCVHAGIGESSQEMRSIPVLYVSVISRFWNRPFGLKPISSNQEILRFMLDICWPLYLFSMISIQCLIDCMHEALYNWEQPMKGTQLYMELSISFQVS